MLVVNTTSKSEIVLNDAIVDYNSWQESETGIKLANSLDKNVVLAEGQCRILTSFDPSADHLKGYKEYDTKRKYLVTLGDWRNNKDEEVELDGIGGVNILVKADVHRSGGHSGVVLFLTHTLNLFAGINFPCYAFENQAETEGFYKMAKRADYKLVGFPNHVV